MARSRRPSFTTCHTRCSTRPRCDAGIPRMPDSTSTTRVVFQPDGGFLLAERTILAHVNGALAAGAELRFREPVLAWEPIGDGVRVVTERGSHDADRLVVCAGAWARTLVPDARAPRGTRAPGPRLAAADARGALRARSIPGVPHRRRGGQPLRLPGARRARLQVRPLPPPRASRSIRRIRTARSDPETRRCCARSPSATSPTEPARR